MNWKEVINKDFPIIDKVTLKMQENAFRQVRLMRGAIRLKLGRISTSDEIERRRREALRSSLL